MKRIVVIIIMLACLSVVSAAYAFGGGGGGGSYDIPEEYLTQYSNEIEGSGSDIFDDGVIDEDEYDELVDILDDYNLTEEFEDDFPNNDVAPAPEPASLVLLGSGLLGLAGAFRKKKQ